PDFWPLMLSYKSHTSNPKSQIGNRKQPLGSSSSQPSTTPKEPFVVSHYQLGLNLGHGIHCHAYQNQQRGPTEVELITHPGRNPAQPGRTADERVQPRTYQGKSRAIESAQTQLA